MTYGNNTDLWGTTWTYTDINASNFGVAIQPWNNDIADHVAYVYGFVTITVWYSTPTVTTYDSGTAWVAVNGVPMSTTYGQGDTSSSVASRLASSINGNGSSPVTASLSGTTVNLTAKATGSATNYSLTSGSSSNNGFSPPSFAVSASGGNLSGGYDVGGALTASTFYQYDAINNLIRVDQKNGDSNSADWRTRTFAYDSLSRLLCAANPEIGTALVTCPNPDNGTYTAGTVSYYNVELLLRRAQPAHQQSLYLAGLPAEFFSGYLRI